MKNKSKVLLALLTALSVLSISSACGLLPGESSSSVSSESVATSDTSSEITSESNSNTDSDSTLDSSVVAPETYTVTFMADGKEVGTATYTSENKEITEPAVPVKDYYTGEWEAYTLESGDITVNAIYTAIEYTITFVADGEEVGSVSYTVEDETVNAPAVPEKECYTGAWEEYALSGGDLTVNAVYTYVGYTVEFVDEDGTVISTADYELGDEVTIPADPVKETDGEYTYTFAGWDKDVTAVEGNTTYTATYTKEAIVYTITFLADGEVVGEDTYSVEDKEIAVPEVPTKDHYTGVWGTYELTIGNIEVNAVYTAIEYTVTFMNGEEVVAEEKFSIESQEITVPEVPAKVGYSGGEWSVYDLTVLEDQTVNAINYTANTYKITYDAGNGTCETVEQEVTYGAEFTLATATAPKFYQEHLGWVDEYGNAVVGSTWNIASDVALTAIYSDGVVFESMSEAPAYMEKADTTESLSIVELDGNKVLQIKSNTDGTTAANRSPALKVTLEFIASFFEDESVDFIAFDAKAGTTTINNFRRVTLRSNGTFAADCYEHDMTYTHDSDGDGAAETYATTGIRADSWKTFYFSRADYNAWVTQGVTSERFIASGQFNQGDSIYVDNIRPVTAAERKAGIGSFESGGVRINDAGKTLLFYTLDQGTTWQFNMQVGSGVFTNVGYTNKNVTDGIRALTFTKAAGNLSFNFPTGKAFNDALITTTGYWAVDVYIPEDSDATIVYNITNWAGVTPKKGGWTTIYVTGDKNQVTITDTTGGTYVVDNIRSISKAEYDLAGLSMEANASGLRTKELGDDTAHSGVCYYYGGADHAANTFSFAIGEGNGAGDVATLKNVRYDSEIVHDGTYSLAIEKGTGYIYFTMRNDSTAFSVLSGGFTFWIYSTTSINGVDTKNFVNGVNEKFNGGEGIMIPANTWTKVTVTAADMNPTRFLIIQGNTEGTIYLDGFAPLGE